MRIMYIGQDHRPRVIKIDRIKFLDDGFTEVDNKNEFMSDFEGMAIIVHLFQNKGGGRRLIFHAHDNFNMVNAEKQILENGWLDLSECELANENRY